MEKEGDTEVITVLSVLWVLSYFRICCIPMNWLLQLNENNEVTQTSERTDIDFCGVWAADKYIDMKIVVSTDLIFEI